MSFNAKARRRKDAESKSAQTFLFPFASPHLCAFAFKCIRWSLWCAIVVMLSASAQAQTRKPLPVPADPKLPTLFLIGDSTVRNGQGDGGGGQWGWGEPLVGLFDKTKINVV